MKRLLIVQDSSNVKMIGYDWETQELDVVYHATPKVIYRFSGVGSSAFCRVIAAVSVGTALAAVTKGRAHTKWPNDGTSVEAAEVVTTTTIVPVPSSIRASAKPASKVEQTMSDEEAYNAVTNRPKKR